VCFAPAFSGLHPPYNDPTCRAAFFGVSFASRPEHFVRALLEALAFRAVELLQTASDDLRIAPTAVRLDGGCSQNKLIVQTIADLAQITIHLPHCLEMTALGAAMLAGVGAQLWSSEEAPRRAVGARIRESVVPRIAAGSVEHQQLSARFAQWKDYMRRLTASP
jgi:glycerol kinase